MDIIESLLTPPATSARRPGRQPARPRLAVWPMVAAAALMLGPAVPAAATSAAAGPFSAAIKPGGFDERCLRLEAGEAIDYDFRADRAIDFNIHYHRGRDVFYPVRLSQVTAVGPQRFVAPAADDYCLMWENRGSAAAQIDGRVAPAR